jgi:hypothetical protein
MLKSYEEKGNFALTPAQPTPGNGLISVPIARGSVFFVLALRCYHRGFLS